MSCYIIAGTLVRSKESVSKPGILVGRIRSGALPEPYDLIVTNGMGGVDILGEVIPPGDDMGLTPSISMDESISYHAYSLVNVPKRSFHVEEMNLEPAHALWNAFYLEWRRDQGNHGRIIRCISPASFMGKVMTSTRLKMR